MIVGRGLIANSLLQYDDESFVFFASGVSNSGLDDEGEFLREKLLLHETMKRNADKHLVYFSTCMVSTTNPANPYSAHKLSMEKLVQQYKNWTVFRLPNLVGKGGNPNNLVNFLVTNVKEKSRVTIQENAKRSILEANDMARLTIAFLSHGSNKRFVDLVLEDAISIFEILETITENLGREAVLHVVPGGLEIGVRNDRAVELAESIKIDVSPGYSIRALRKWIKSE